MADDQVTVQGPDGKTYQFPSGTTKEAAIGYFKKKGIGAPKQEAQTITPPKEPAKPEPTVSRNRMVPGPGGGFQQSYSMPESTYKKGANLTLEGLGGAAGAEFGGAITAGSKLPWLMQMLARASSAGMGTGAGTLASDPKHPAEALSTAAKTTMTAGALEGGGTAAVKTGKALLGKVGDPLVRINELLGVKAEDIIPGKTPASLDEFVANPARGLTKSGLSEQSLKKMNVFERNAAVDSAMDKAGKQLDAILSQADAAGKTINVQKVINDTFAEITNKKLGAQASEKLLQIIAKAGTTKPLSQLSPTEARAIQRGLDNFANFETADVADSFKDIATQLRRGISQETRKVVPGSAEPDQLYTDLVRAKNATNDQLVEYTRKTPENTLRKTLIKGMKNAAPWVIGLGGLYEMGKAYRNTPVP